MTNKSNKSDTDIKAFVLTYWPFLLGAFALFVEFPMEYMKFRLFLMWLALWLSALIAAFRKEIPRLYPYPSIKGQLAQTASSLILIFWSFIGLVWFLVEIFQW